MLLRSGYFSLAFFVLLAACHRPYYLQKQSSLIYVVDKTTATDSSMLAMIQPYKQSMQQKMQEVIAYNDTMLTRSQPASALGNLLSDAQLNAARKVDEGVVASVANYGGIRLPYLAAGPVTVGKMYELMPFDNSIVIVEVPGTIMQEFCNHIASLGGWPVSGIRFAIKNNQATNIEIGNSPLSLGQTYKVAVNDYLAGGGDKCSFLKPLKVHPLNIFVRDALIGHVRQQQMLRVNLEKRIYHAE